MRNAIKRIVKRIRLRRISLSGFYNYLFQDGNQFTFQDNNNIIY